MPQPTKAKGRVNEALRNLSKARSAVEQARMSAESARNELKERQATLAEALRNEAVSRLGSVSDLCRLIESEVQVNGVPRWREKTVWNALYETHQPQILMACAEVLAAHPQPAHAA